MFTNPDPMLYSVGQVKSIDPLKSDALFGGAELMDLRDGVGIGVGLLLSGSLAGYEIQQPERREQFHTSAF